MILSIEVKFVNGTTLALNTQTHGTLSYETADGQHTIKAVNRGVTTIYHVSLSTMTSMKITT